MLVSSAVPYVETIAVRDVFVSGVSSVSIVGKDLYRVTFYAESICSFDGRRERTVVARIILGRDAIFQSRDAVFGAVDKHRLFPDNH